MPLAWKGFGLLSLRVNNMGSGSVLSKDSEMLPTWVSPEVFSWHLAVSGLSLLLILTISERKRLGFHAWAFAFCIGAYVEQNAAIAALAMFSITLIRGRPVYWQRHFFWISTRIGVGIAWPMFPKNAAKFTTEKKST